jgi:riboflavin kinase / FMN adenylyltransferase
LILKTITSLNDFYSTAKTIITIGSFDGVHIGHQKIIEKLIANAASLSCESLVLTFFPHPKTVLNPTVGIQSLNTIDEKINLLQKTGLQNLVIHPFDKNFSDLSAEDFVKKILVDKFNIRKIIIGYDHRFGKNRAANVEDLIQFGQKYNFEIEQIPAQEIDAVAVSSTIRTALLAGDIELANQFLGYNYMLTGTIVQGKQLGRTIGFPTANLQIDADYKLIPKTGVYIVQSFIDNALVFGMMNIGFNPTVGGQNLSTEIHLFDFNTDLYNKKILVSVLSKIREEHKFDSIELLKNQLKNDKIFALDFIKNKLKC